MVIERKSFQVKVFSSIAVAAMLFNTLGCSLFSPRVSTGGPENANFRQQASSASNPIPLPVEIVSDISTIASGGSVPQEGVWRPAYPEVGGGDADETTSSQIGPDGNPVAMAAKEVTMNADGTVKESADTQDDFTTAATPTGKLRRKHRRVASTGGKTESYKVRSGDTLMKISFEKYGNIYRWREIYDTNKSRIANLNKLVAGTLLSIQGVEYIVIERNGTPYLIRRGDTLVKISKNLYNTPTEWKALWNNNRQLIHDPNKIYAGFTMYYVPKRTDEIPQQVRQISTEKPDVKPKASLRGKLKAWTKIKPTTSVTPNRPSAAVTPAGPESNEPDSRSIPGVNLSAASVTTPPTGMDTSPPSADGAWTAAPATAMEATPATPPTKP